MVIRVGACEKISASISSLPLARYRSVTTHYRHRQVWVKGYVQEVVIACASKVIAKRMSCQSLSDRKV